MVQGLRLSFGLGFRVYDRGSRAMVQGLRSLFGVQYLGFRGKSFVLGV